MLDNGCFYHLSWFPSSVTSYASKVPPRVPQLDYFTFGDGNCARHFFAITAFVLLDANRRQISYSNLEGSVSFLFFLWSYLFGFGGMCEFLALRIPNRKWLRESWYPSFGGWYLPICVLHRNGSNAKPIIDHQHEPVNKNTTPSARIWKTLCASLVPKIGQVLFSGLQCVMFCKMLFHGYTHQAKFISLIFIIFFG